MIAPEECEACMEVGCDCTPNDIENYRERQWDRQQERMASGDYGPDKAKIEQQMREAGRIR